MRDLRNQYIGDFQIPAKESPELALSIDRSRVDERSETIVRRWTVMRSALSDSTRWDYCRITKLQLYFFFNLLSFVLEWNDRILSTIIAAGRFAYLPRYLADKLSALSCSWYKLIKLCKRDYRTDPVCNWIQI